MKTLLCAFAGKTFSIPAHEYAEDSYRAAALTLLSFETHQGRFDPRSIMRKSACDELRCQLNVRLRKAFPELDKGYSLSRKGLREVLELMKANMAIYQSGTLASTAAPTTSTAAEATLA